MTHAIALHTASGLTYRTSSALDPRICGTDQDEGLIVTRSREEAEEMTAELAVWGAIGLVLAEEDLVEG